MSGAPRCHLHLAMLVAWLALGESTLGAKNHSDSSEFYQLAADSDQRRLLASEAEPPAELDWRRTPGRVAPVQNQMHCNAGWAFATAGLLEGQLATRGRPLEALSAQQLVDCGTIFTFGCNGGSPLLACLQVAAMGGLQGAQSYPYEDQEAKCRFRRHRALIRISGGAQLARGDELGLRKLVAEYGPVAVSLSVTNSLLSYSSGVFFDPTCSSEPAALSHAALLVGYGSEGAGRDFWIIKNSWGERGYLRLARNRNNQCGVASAATVATFD